MHRSKSILFAFFILVILPLSAQKKKKDKVRIYYFTATWCGPCKVFQKARKTDAMKKALANARITKIDIDNDRRRLKEIYNVKEVPTFLKMGKKGKVISKLDSRILLRGISLDGTVDYDYMAKVMDEFVNTNNVYQLNK